MRDPLEGRGSDGTIVTGAGRQRVPSTFEPVLAACVAAIVDPQISVHLYGSVATGTARVGASDVDLLAVGLHPETGRAVQEQMSRRFRHLTRGVEIAVAQPEDFVGEGDQPYGNRVFLKHYCVLLAGPDRRAALAPAAADARGRPWLQRRHRPPSPGLAGLVDGGLRAVDLRRSGPRSPGSAQDAAGGGRSGERP